MQSNLKKKIINPKKIIFISTLPRGGGKAITELNLIKQNPNIFLWPYEFFYSNIYNEAIAQSSKINQINNFFIKNSFNKFFSFLRKKNINTFDREVFLEYLKNFKKRLSKNNYLEHIIRSMIKSSKFHNYNRVSHVFIHTTLRGLMWDKSINDKNYFFIDTNREVYESFKSIRSRTINSSGFDNFFSLKGKKSFFYWLESYQKLLNLKKKLLKKKIICCLFENLNFEKYERILIRNQNEKLLRSKLKINYSEKNFLSINFYFSIHKKKITSNINILPIENSLFAWKTKKKLYYFLYPFFKSIWIYKKILYTHKEKKIFYKLTRFFYNFLKYYIFITLAPKKYYKTIIDSNKHLKYADFWNN